MAEEPVSVDFVRDLLGDRLTRNLGLHGDSITACEIHHNSEFPSLGILKIKHYGGELMCPVILDGSDVFADFYKIEIMRSIINAGNDNFKVNFQGIDVIEGLQQDDIDVTNLHGLMLSDNKQYHLKVFVNLKNSLNELRITQEMANKSLYPKVRGWISYRGIPFIIVWDRMEVVNCDEYLGRRFVKIIAGEIDLSDGLEGVRGIYTSCESVLEQFWHAVSEPQIHVETRQTWIDKFNNDSSTVHEILGKQIINKTGIDRINEWLRSCDMIQIHGDVWLRQFVRSKDKIFLMDLEDVRLGPAGYDIGGLYNSILQQGAYFEFEYPQQNPQFSALRYCETYIGEVQKKSPVGSDNIARGRTIRAYHELCYLLKHQPEMNWLIDYIVDMVGDIPISEK